MPEPSYNSVKVSYLNKEEIFPQLRQAAHLIKQRSEVLRVYLFGSLVRGDHAPGSDADIAIVLSQDGRRIIDRIPDFLGYFREVEVPVDVFPYTLAETEEMQKSKNPMWREILATGIEL